MEGKIKRVGGCVSAGSKKGKELGYDFIQSVLFRVFFGLQIEQAVFV